MAFLSQCSTIIIKAWATQMSFYFTPISLDMDELCWLFSLSHIWGDLRTQLYFGEIVYKDSVNSTALAIL